MRLFKKIGLISGGGLSYVYVDEKKRGVETHHPEISVKDTSVPHPDLTKIFDNFREPLIGMLGIDLGRGLLLLTAAPDTTIKQRNSVENLTEIIEDARKRLIEKIQVTGVTLSGIEDDKPKILISATLEVANGAKVAINSPLVSVTGSSFGVESRLHSLLEELLDETAKYIDEDKRAQLSLFGSGLDGDGEPGSGAEDPGDEQPEEEKEENEPGSAEPGDEPTARRTRKKKEAA